MKALNKLFLYGTVGLLLGWTLAVAFINFYPFTLVEVRQPMRVLSNVVERGDTLAYVIDYCKFTKIKPTIERFLVSEVGEKYMISSPPYNANVGCAVATGSILIPDDVKTGRYYIRVESTFFIPPTREMLYTYVSESFEIK